jgi:phenylacetate-CoA ligase
VKRATTDYWWPAMERLDPDVREAEALTKLKQRLDDTLRTSAFYRDKYAVTGASSEDVRDRDSLALLPFVTKEELIADQAGDPPYGSIIGCEPDDLVRLYVGPGPQAGYFTTRDLEAAIDRGAWVFFTHGFRSDDVVDVTAMYHWLAAGTLLDASYQRIGCATIPGGAGMAETHIDNLRWTRATGLFSFPSFLERMAEVAATAGIDLANDLCLQKCSIAGEISSPSHKARMEAAWGGMAIREQYGCSEVASVAADCGQSPGMHLAPGVFVEVLHPVTRKPVLEGEPGVLVLTDLTREASPSVRFWTGDITAGIVSQDCPCGRTMPRMMRIEGRVSDIVRVKGRFIVPKQVSTALASVPGIGAARMILERPGVQDVITVDVERERSELTDEVLSATVASALKLAIGLTCAVAIVKTGSVGSDGFAIEDRRVANDGS